MARNVKTDVIEKVLLDRAKKKRINIRKRMKEVRRQEKDERNNKNCLSA